MWLAIGRLTEQKAYPNLLRAFSTVVDSLPRSKLVVVGRGPLRAELESLVQAWELRDRVSFLGFRDDVPELLAAADALIMGSRYEGMPNAVVEALASELPVVATNVGAIPELIEEGVNGYLVPPSDPQALSRAMTKLAMAPRRERLEMGRRGRTSFESFATSRPSWTSGRSSSKRPCVREQEDGAREFGPRAVGRPCYIRSRADDTRRGRIDERA